MTAASHDDYLAGLPAAQSAALADLRGWLGAELPMAQEVISYAIPGYRIGKKVVAGYAAFKAHCSFFPHSGTILPGFADELARLGHSHTISALHFTPDRPIPRHLLRRILDARLAEAGLGTTSAP